MIAVAWSRPATWGLVADDLFSAVDYEIARGHHVTDVYLDPDTFYLASTQLGARLAEDGSFAIHPSSANGLVRVHQVRP